MFALVNLLFCHAWFITCHPAAGNHSRVVASIHLITVDAGLLLGYCRADAGLLLNGFYRFAVAGDDVNVDSEEMYPQYTSGPTCFGI